MENKKALLRAYNKEEKTKFKLFGQIYWHEPTAAAAAKKLGGITPRTLCNWVLQEGGRLRNRGGGTTLLRKILRNITPEVLKEMTPTEVADLTGHSYSFCYQVMRDMGVYVYRGPGAI